MKRRTVLACTVLVAAVAHAQTPAVSTCRNRLFVRQGPLTQQLLQVFGR